MSQLIKFALLLCLILSFAVDISYATSDNEAVTLVDSSITEEEKAGEAKKRILLRSIPIMASFSYAGFIAFSLNADPYTGFTDSIPAGIITSLYLLHKEDQIDFEKFALVFSSLSIIYLFTAYMSLAVLDVFNQLDSVWHNVLRLVFYVLLSFYFQGHWKSVMDHLDSPKDGIEYVVTRLGEIGNRLSLFNTLLLVPGAVEKTFQSFNKTK